MLKVITIKFIMIACLIGCGVAFYSYPANAQELSVFERQIVNHVQNKEFLKAIQTCAEYERNLISRYPKPTFKNGIFQSESENMFFRSAFINWKESGSMQKQLISSLSTLGFNLLLALKGNNEQDQFFLCSVNVGQIEKQMGLQTINKMYFTDREMLLMSKSLATGFGIVRTEEFRKLGYHHVLVSEIDTPMLGPSISLVTFAQQRRLYICILTSSVLNYQRNMNQLFDTIKNIKFEQKKIRQAAVELRMSRLSLKID
jgi:hypothetical protein